ncbi:MAG: patatin-like phospholipase family protein [Pseudolabrys sp.]|jgi:NTE family protein|nr:patatin-like phospholipase family protein [Pseudolabrys sp.]
MIEFLARAFGGGKSEAPKAGKHINLALQGGGALGAFTWGVLDHLLEDSRLTIEGISGASAGAVNAIMLADGLARGGPEEGRKRLSDFWHAASLGGNLPDVQRRAIDRLFSFWPIEDTPVGLWMQALTRYLSPYDFNPLNINPLKDLVGRFVDFDAVRACTDLQLFVSATNVRTGELHVFKREEMTADMIVASACLPHMFRAVEIDAEAYWDGGYVGNPALYPLVGATQTENLLLVQINPVKRKQIPKTQNEILARINEITFNSSLVSELRGLAFVGKLIDEGKLPRGTGVGQYRRINVHRIELTGAAQTLDAASRLSTDADFFEMLHNNGRRAARRFLDAHYDDIGVRSTVDFEAAPEGTGA